MNTKTNYDIKVLFSDIDGTLTDGSLFYSSIGETIKVFHVKDGHGIKEWMKAGNIFGVISARGARATEIRMEELKVKNCFLNIPDKKKFLDQWLIDNKLEWSNLAYIGDDLNDMEVLKEAAISAIPADASDSIIKENIDYVCRNNGGKGAVREFIDFLLDNREIAHR